MHTGLLQIAQLKGVHFDIGGSGTLQNLLDWSHDGIENTTRLQHRFQLFSGSVAPNLHSKKTNEDKCTSRHPMYFAVGDIRSNISRIIAE